MTINKLKALLADKLRGNTPSAILYSDKPTGQPPMSLFDIEEQTQFYLAVASGDGLYKGMFTGGLAGVGGLGFAVLALIVFFDGNYEAALIVSAVAVSLFVFPFLWEVLRPISTPIIFNRRTREIYFKNGDELFYTPWDGIEAIACQFQMVGPYSGGTRHASLEILVQCFGAPEKQLLLSLGLPIGKSLELQEGFWEYLRSYMNNGPWFDERGNHSESDSFVKEQLKVGENSGKILQSSWMRIVREYKKAGGKNFLDVGDLIMLVCAFFLQPMNSIQDFTYRIAKSRSRKQWPKLVAERLDPNGPTTRLIDIEHASDVKQEPDQGGMGQ